MAPTPTPASIERDLERNRKRRERITVTASINHAVLVELLRAGYAQRLDVTKMARLAGISRATAHRLLKSDD